MINTPTRGRGLNKPSLIDLLFTTNEEDVESIDIDSPLGKSDHSVIKIKYRCQGCLRKLFPTTKKANYQRMKKRLDNDWSTQFGRYVGHVSLKVFRG